MGDEVPFQKKIILVLIKCLVYNGITSPSWVTLFYNEFNFYTVFTEMEIGCAT